MYAAIEVIFRPIIDGSTKKTFNIDEISSLQKIKRLLKRYQMLGYALYCEKSFLVIQDP